MPSCPFVDLRKPRFSTPPGWLFTLVALGAFAFLLSVYVAVWSNEYGLTKFITAGRAFDERGIAAYRATPKYLDPYPPHQWGFDGQLYAELSLDPLLLDPGLDTALDNPPYRARRILLSWLAWLGGLGQPVWILNVFAALNLVFWVGYAWLAHKLFRPHGWAGLAGFSAILVTCGIIECMHGSLTDFPSFVLMTWATVIGGTGGAALLAAALLGRETCALGFIGIAEFGRPWKDAFKKNLVRGLIAVIPLTLWIAYVTWRFRHRESGLDGGNLEPPLAGIMAKLGEFTVTASHGSIRWNRLFFELYKSYELHGLLTVISLFTQCVYIATHREWSNRLWRFAAIFVPYFLCIGYLTWEPHFTVTRHALPITFVFNLMLAIKPRRGWLAWFVLGNCFVPYGVYYFHQQGNERSPPPPVEFAIVAPAHVTPAIRAEYATGWSTQQWRVTDTWRWGLGATADLTLRNDTAQPATVEFSFLARSVKPRGLKVAFRGETVWQGQLGPLRQVITLNLRLPAGASQITFSSSEPATEADDPTARDVTFMVAAPRVEILPPKL